MKLFDEMAESLDAKVTRQQCVQEGPYQANLEHINYRPIRL